MTNAPMYLVRYGLMGHVGRFPLDRGREFEVKIERGQSVVVQTDRGFELGEVLLAPEVSFQPGDSELQSDADRQKLLRLASQADLEDARRSQSLRAERFSLCQRILGDGRWPLDLIDVEPLLDPSRTVLHIVGPVNLDLAALRAEFRSRSEFDVVFEPAGPTAGGPSRSTAAQGLDASVDQPVPRCGDCNCSEGGCKTKTSESRLSQSHSACASCGISQWLAGKRREDRAALNHQC